MAMMVNTVPCYEDARSSTIYRCVEPSPIGRTRLAYGHYTLGQYTLSFQTLKGRQVPSQWSDLLEIQTLMHVLVACKNEDYPSKNEGARVFTTSLTL